MGVQHRDDMNFIHAIVGDDGVVKVLDKNGLRIAGIRNVQINAPHDDVSEITIKLMLYDAKGNVVCYNRQRKS